MNIYLERFSYSETETEGVLTLPYGGSFNTIERPWVPSPVSPGGTPHKSCIPEGEYRLEPWNSPRFGRCLILSAPDLGVYKLPDDVPMQGGRSLILVHVANWASRLKGCIGVGLERAFMPDMRRDNRVRPAVRDSSAAMGKILDVVTEATTLFIGQVQGAKD